MKAVESKTDSKRSTLRCVAAAVLILVCIAGLAWLAAPRFLVAQIRNDQVHWDGNYFGLAPQIRGTLPRLIFMRGRACVPYLIEALNDDSRFIAAHVYLSLLSRGGFQTSAEAFNGLRVELYADGTTAIAPEQKQTLLTRWNSK